VIIKYARNVGLR